jgi:hypothetical protein
VSADLKAIVSIIHRTNSHAVDAAVQHIRSDTVVARRIFAERLEPRKLLSATTINSADAIPFTQDVIDANPGNNPVVKFLVDIDNNGKEDAVVGHETNEGGAGIDLYQFPASGNPADIWTESVIDPTADVYESMRAADVSGNVDSNGNPVNDLIVNERGTVYWYENPLGLGEDPYTSPWQKFEIGTVPQGATHEMYISTTLSGNGDLAVVDNTCIFFEVSPTDWVQTPEAAYNRTEKGLYLFNSGLGPGDVDLLGTGNGPDYQLGWYENPLDYGGNPMTDQWIFHPIGPAYGNYVSGDGVSYAAMDVTGSGQEDIITCDGENGEYPPYLTGGLIWWQRPSNILTGTWIPHTIDSSITDVHNLVLADLQNNGQTEILAFEQDQSPQGRLLILFNEGGTGQNWLEQTLASDSDPAEGGGEGGHNESVGDATGDGYLDILTSPHGFYTLVNPISLYVNDLPADGITEPTVTDSPVNQAVYNGDTFTFRVSAMGTGDLTYQWEENGLDIPGATSPTYTATASSADSGALFRCIVGNPGGLVPSDSAMLTVAGPSISVTNPAHSNPPVVTISKTHLLVAAEGVDGVTGLTYKWRVTYAPTGAKDPTLSDDGALPTVIATFDKDGGYGFACTITGSDGVSTVSYASVDVEQAATKIVVNPSDTNIKRGSRRRFSAVSYDQFGHVMRAQPAFTYSILQGPGVIDPITGLYQANNTTGELLVEVADGDVTTRVKNFVVN